MSADMKRLLLWGLFMPGLFMPGLSLVFAVGGDYAANRREVAELKAQLADHWVINTRLTELEAALERERAARRGVEGELEREREERLAVLAELREVRHTLHKAELGDDHWAILTELETALKRERAARREAEHELAAVYDQLAEVEAKGNRPILAWGRAEEGALNDMIRAVHRCLWVPSLRENFGEALRATLTTLRKQRGTPLQVKRDRDGNVLLRADYRSESLLSPRTLRRSAEDLERAVDEYGTGTEHDALVELIRSTRTYARILDYNGIK